MHGFDEIARAALASSLDQMSRHAAAIAGGSVDDEDVHQLRIGIRRVRTVLRELMPQAGEQNEAPLVEAFRALGARRDADHVLRKCEARLLEAGAPVLAKPDARQLPEPADIVAAPRFRTMLRKLTAISRQRTAAASHDDPRKRFASLLGKLARKMLADGCRFEEIDAARQHRVRKRAKRLRYVAEFAAPLYGEKKVKAWLAEMKRLQDRLGAYNDEQAALSLYRERAARDPRAWFAVGWLTARQERNARTCAKALRRFATAEPFWE